MIKSCVLIFIFLLVCKPSVSQKVSKPNKYVNPNKQNIQILNESRWNYLIRADSTRTSDINSLKRDVSVIQADIDVLKMPKTDNLKYVLPLISLLLGFLFTIGWNVLRDRYKDHKLEQKAINRWKAGLSILPGGIHNQIKYNEEVIQKLSTNRVESEILPFHWTADE